MPNHYTTVAIGSVRYDDEKDDYAFNPDEFNSHVGDWNFCEQVRPMPVELKDNPPVSNPPWLVWAREHWGTKWGTYNEKAYILGGDGLPVMIEFQSAWGPPSDDCLREIAKWMDEVLGIEEVKFVGHQPYDNTTRFIDLEDYSS